MARPLIYLIGGGPQAIISCQFQNFCIQQERHLSHAMLKRNSTNSLIPLSAPCLFFPPHLSRPRATLQPVQSQGSLHSDCSTSLRFSVKHASGLSHSAVTSIARPGSGLQHAPSSCFPTLHRTDYVGNINAICHFYKTGRSGHSTSRNRA